jgi:hypothetical protein
MKQIISATLDCEILTATIRTSLPELSLVSFSSVNRAMIAIDSRRYSGVFIEDIGIPLSRVEILSSIPLNKEEESLPYGAGGIYLARYAVQAGLPTLVAVVSPNEMEIARKVGATPINLNEDTGTFVFRAVKEFQRLFIDPKEQR